MMASIKDINDPKDLRALDVDDLPEIAKEIRDIIINTVSCLGGHLGPPLGVVELTIALHYVFDTPRDQLVWDVGHQAYAHKILTGRRDQFSTLKQYEGISGYPNVHESEYDLFTLGHSSTSISQALGLATVRDLNGTDEKVIAVIGDGALTAGLAFEAINNAGQMKKDLIIILNDNEMSISKNVGAMAEYLNRIITAPVYNKVRSEVRSFFKKFPDSISDIALHATAKLEESLKGLLVPGMLFEELGFLYSGPIDGHNLPGLIHTFESLKKLSGPILLHVITKKGKGYEPAEAKPDAFHGTGSFDIETGEAIKKSDEVSFTKVFSESMVRLGKTHKDLIGLSAAMPTGVGLVSFSEQYPDRFFDVGIAEQHCVTFAGALSKGGKKPVVAIYATFLQRAMDQVIHDVCLQNAPVVFCLDRMGIVGEDGASHSGVFAIPLLRGLHNMVVMLPKDGEELVAMMNFAMTWNGPLSICYPKSNVCDELFEYFPKQSIEIGCSEVLQKGDDVAIFALGSMVPLAVNVTRVLEQEGVSVSLINMRFVKPFDVKTLKEIVSCNKKVLVIEEGVLMGGAGSALLESLEREEIYDVEVKCLGVSDQFVAHGARSIILKNLGLSEENIIKQAKKLLDKKDLV